MKVVVTGASGLLGTAVYNAFRSHHDVEVVGLAHSRSSAHLRKLDLCNVIDTAKFFSEFKPNWVIHCAGERRPDVAEQNPEAARNLNVDATLHLGSLSLTLKFILVYISTDYVFDGSNPPYSSTSTPNPVNFYGSTKHAGEAVIINNPMCFVLRVPVLYGPAPKNSDSAVNILLDVVQDQSGEQYTIDDYAIRYPTNVLDIANFLVRLTASHLSNIPPILHYSASEAFTKYRMCLVFAKILQLPVNHITRDGAAPQGNGALSRPRDCKLDIKDTKGVISLNTTGFEEWWSEQLSKNK